MHHARLQRSLAVMLPACIAPRLGLMVAPRRSVATSARGGPGRTWSPNIPRSTGIVPCPFCHSGPLAGWVTAGVDSINMDRHEKKA